jgi:hypothetical protein
VGDRRHVEDTMNVDGSIKHSFALRVDNWPSTWLEEIFI